MLLVWGYGKFGVVSVVKEEMAVGAPEEFALCLFSV